MRARANSKVLHAVCFRTFHFATVVKHVNSLLLNVSFQVTLTIYGTYLNQVQQSLISLAIKQAYASVNAGRKNYCQPVFNQTKYEVEIVGVF